jgi:hypothetical protein
MKKLQKNCLLRSKKEKNILLLLLLLLCSNGYSQILNYISNGGFEEAITNKFLSELNDLTIHFCSVLNYKVNEFEKNEIKLEQLLIEKDRIIEKYYLAQEELIKKLWL